MLFPPLGEYDRADLADAFATLCDSIRGVWELIDFDELFGKTGEDPELFEELRSQFLNSKRSLSRALSDHGYWREVVRRLKSSHSPLGGFDENDW